MKGCHNTHNSIDRSPRHNWAGNVRMGCCIGAVNDSTVVAVYTVGEVYMSFGAHMGRDMSDNNMPVVSVVDFLALFLRGMSAKMSKKVSINLV